MLFTGRSFTRFLLLNLLVLNMHLNTSSMASTAEQLNEDQEVTDSLLPAIKGATKEYSQFLNAFESRLFRLFGLKSRPKPKKNLQIPEYMIELYRQSHASTLSKTMHQFRRINLNGFANTIISHKQHEGMKHMASKHSTQMYACLHSTPNSVPIQTFLSVKSSFSRYLTLYSP